MATEIFTFAQLKDGTQLWNATPTPLDLVAGDEKFTLPPSGRVASYHHEYGIYRGLPFVQNSVVYIVADDLAAIYQGVRGDIITASYFQDRPTLAKAAEEETAQGR